ncbi:single-stranded-DNA-specific exonuclease RecJ [Permianibacter fluminis]|uniref:single-stranded-DNA-specific exonuclease RecJ n=1 Tax=Permianibacter fluminis TaxID=2738515 RepID=UPI0038B374F4
MRLRPSLSPSAELQSLPPLLARVYANRGVTRLTEIDTHLQALLPPSLLAQSERAADLLIDAMQQKKRIVVVGDFDADGATSSALAVLGLRALGATAVSFRVPDRFRYGYGLTPPIVEEVIADGAELIVTVDNGIASIDGIALAKARGVPVLVTDHHLPGEQLPDAAAIVNPNAPGCAFPSKALAGVGVMFYVLLATRARLRERGLPGAEVNLAQFLDLVALGTVADVVPLDQNNRILVQQGLQRIRAGQCRPGIRALLMIAKREREHLVASDLGFSIGPRLNAAGRLDDMSLGINCLLAESDREAMTLAAELDALNHERREIEDDMLATAEQQLLRKLREQPRLPPALCLFDDSWHQGVIGILAGRLKDRCHRPAICLADAGDGWLKGSGRSIPGVHLRDVLATIANQHPDMLSKFGGHAMAAGLTLHQHQLATFAERFATEVARQLGPEPPERELWSDGELSSDDLVYEQALQLRQAGPWGQLFPEPLFHGEFEVIGRRTMAERHRRLTLRHRDGTVVEAVAFNVERLGYDDNASTVQLVYRLDVNHYGGQRKLQLTAERFL